MQTDSLPLVIVLFTLMGAFTMPFLAHWLPKACRPWALLVIGLDVLMAGRLLLAVQDGPIIRQFVGDWAPPWGIEVLGDPLSALLLLLIASIVFLILIYAARALERELPPGRIGWYYVLVMLCTAGMMGLAVSNDLFNMYVMIEIISLSACSLVVARGNKPALVAAFKYLMLATIGSGFLLLGVGLIYGSTGHLNLDYAAAELLHGDNSAYLTWSALTFMVVGIIVKAGIFPLHFWLPDAHSSAPTTSSAMLSGLVVKVYIVVIVRLIYVLYAGGLDQALFLQKFLPIMGAASLIFGSFFALIQKDLKRLLAYSTIAQLGYIFLGLGLMNEAGMLAAFYHIPAHALMKTLLFLSAGNLVWKRGSRNIWDMSGMGRTMPISSVIFSLAAFCMIGFPLLAGFITKYLLAIAGLEEGMPWILVLVVFSGLLNAAYYLPVIVILFFKGEKQPIQADAVPLGRLIPLGVLAIGLLAIGLMPTAGFEFLERAIEALIH